MKKNPNFAEINRNIGEYFYANKLVNLDEEDKILKKHNYQNLQKMILQR